MKKHVITTIILLPILLSSVYAQSGASETTKRPKDWWQADLKKDSIPGISLDEAYSYLKGRKSKPVIVAIIDDCIDTAHEDLKGVSWMNKKEIESNGIDDDDNGYIDDVHGWCFVCNKNNGSQNAESSDEVRTYLTWQKQFKNVDTSQLKGTFKIQYEVYQEAKKMLFGRYQLHQMAAIVQADSAKFLRYVNSLLPGYRDKRLNEVPFLTLPSSNTYDSSANLFFADLIKLVQATITIGRLDDRLRNNPKFFRMYFEGSEITERNEYDTTKNYRSVIGDDDNDFSIKYGSPVVNMKGHSNEHATFIAGIIAANRQNNIGIKGIANNVSLMSVVIGKNGPARDKDMVFAIRYAVDNGASVINISIGGSIGEHVREVMEAFDYASQHGVLIVHSAGNDGANLDDTFYHLGLGTNGKEHDECICVGATTASLSEGLVSGFSDFGERTVDLFAPGSAIYSTLPDNQYASENGTSFSGPIVAGVAALLKSYFSTLTAKQIKEIIIKSAYKPDLLVIPPDKPGTKVPLSKLSKSGGIVNAYNAVKVADEITKKNK